MAFSHSSDWNLIVVFGTLSLVAGCEISDLVGLAFAWTFLIALLLTFGVQATLVQVAQRYKSTTADKLMGMHVLVCSWAFVAALIVGALRLAYLLW
ncbi:MAG TPA: hypothetical protein VFE62_01130 [Gemmataceae bacterium]|nr:hypothetical protein [Gemmataceae bacterium]